jgi:hypothetical protein
VDFWDVTKLIFRRWYIALPLLLASIGATAYTWVTVKPDYALTSYIQMVPPTSADASANNSKGAEPGVPRNPWTELGLGSLSQASQYSTQDQTFLDQLSAGGHSINFSIVMGYPSPIATIEVIAPTRQEAETTMNLIIKKYEDTTKSLQGQYGVRQQDMITTQRLDQGENIKRSGGKVKRAIVAVAGVGVLLSAGLTIAFDAIVRRRKRARSKGAAALVGDERAAAAPVSGSGLGIPRPSTEETQVLRRNLPAAATQSTGSQYRSSGYREPSDEHGDREVRRTDRPEPVDMSTVAPADATIVLPASTRMVGENGGKRR